MKFGISLRFMRVFAWSSFSFQMSVWGEFFFRVLEQKLCGGRWPAVVTPTGSSPKIKTEEQIDVMRLFSVGRNMNYCWLFSPWYKEQTFCLQNLKPQTVIGGFLKMIEFAKWTLSSAKLITLSHSSSLKFKINPFNI